MKNVLGIVETHPTLNRSFKKAAEKLNSEIDLQMEKISWRNFLRKLKEFKIKYEKHRQQKLILICINF